MDYDTRRGIVGDLEDRAASPFERVERAVRPDLEVDGARELGREAGHGVSGERVELADKTTAVVGEEIDAKVFVRELRSIRIVEDSTCDRASLRMRVLIKRISEARVAADPLARGPAVVGARDAVIDLLRCVLPDVVDEHPPAGRIEVKGERIAETEGPDR